MTTDTTAAAESTLLATRDRLHALGVPADDLPDDLVPVAVGGSLMPTLPGWTKRRARDWAALAIDRPVMARRMIDWVDRNAGRLANLGWITAWLTITCPGLILSMGRRDFGPGEDFGREVAETRDRVDLSGSARIDEMQVDGALDAVFARLNHIPRPWHAELTAAIAAARRGDIRPGTLVTIDAAHRSYACDCPAITRLRILDDAVAAHLTAHVHRTNAWPFCGAGPRELLLGGMRTDNIGGDARRQVRLSYDFRFRPGLPWSRRLRLDGGYAEALDPAGNPAYELADFFELP
jgi:hypothetical protein